MAKKMTLRLLLPSDLDETDYEYSLLDETGQVILTGCCGMAFLPQADRLLLVVPTAALTLCRVKLPANVKFRSPKFYKLLPAAVEDHILSDVADVHLAAGLMDSTGHYPVAVVDKSWLQAHTERFYAGSIPVVGIVPAVLFGSVEEGCWLLDVQKSDCVLKMNDGSVVWLDAIEKDPPVALLLRLRQTGSADRPEKLKLQTDLSLDVEQWASQLGLVVEKLSKKAEPLWMTEEKVPGLNFGIGEFLPPRRKTALDWRRFKWPLMALFALMGLMLLDATVTLIRDQYHRNQLKQSIEGVFRSSFPEQAKDQAVIADPVGQMRQELIQLKHKVGEPGEGDFLPMLSTAANVLAKYRVHRLRSIDYADGVLTCQMGSVPERDLTEIIRLFKQADYQAQSERVAGGGVALKVMLP